MFSATAHCSASALLVLRLRFRIPHPLVFLAKDSRGFLGFEPGFGQRPEILDRDLLAPVDGFVADDDADDVAVAPGEVDGGGDLALVAVGVLVDPDADGDLEAELRCDRRNQLVAFRRRIEPERPGERREISPGQPALCRCRL